MRLTADLTPLRASRDLRLLVLGNFVSGLGTQAALVALPTGVLFAAVSAGATVATLSGPRFSMTSGGLACIAGALAVMLAFPQLAAFDARDHE